MPLEVTTGHATAAGPRPQNEDFVGMVTPTGDELARKGIVLAIADGVSGHAGGREAAEYTVRGLLTDCYATPDTWETTVAPDRVLIAINRWVISQAQVRREVSGMATTLTALVLRGRRAVFAHIGDTRAYRLRNGTLQRLTVDHVWDRPDMAHVLKRAVGLDRDLRIDYGEVDLDAGDRFLLVCDGVWSALSDDAMRRLSIEHAHSQLLADALVEQALAADTRGNASALVADVRSVPDGALSDVLATTVNLPIPPFLKPGTVFDGFRVGDVLHRNSAVRSITYRPGMKARPSHRHSRAADTSPSRNCSPSRSSFHVASGRCIDARLFIATSNPAMFISGRTVKSGFSTSVWRNPDWPPAC